MERRWLNARRFFLHLAMPFLRLLPLPMASRLIAGVGRAEFRLHRDVRRNFLDAVAHARARLDCAWDVPAVSLDLAGNHVLWRTRDLLLDGVPDHRAEPMFAVSRRAILDEALARGKGVILLTSHFGAHLLPTHWLARHGYPIRFYMERPKHISRFLRRHFQVKGPISQDKLFISRKGDPSDSAVSILRATRALNAGMVLYLAGDVRWSGPHTQPGRFLGRRHQFSATWINLAAMTGAPVVPVFCQMRPEGTYHIEFHPAYQVGPDAPRSEQAPGLVQEFLTLLEAQVRSYPSNSNEYFFWPGPDEQAA